MRRRIVRPLLRRGALAVVGAAALAVGGGAVMSRATDPPQPSGPATAISQAVRVSPPQPRAANPGSESCPPVGHAAVVDRANQRAWLCTDGSADLKFPITTAISQPNPGSYKVYAKDKVTTSTFGGHFSYLDNFVAFTYGTRTGARIAFHAVPRNAAGDPFEPYDAVGTRAWYGQSSGCIRVLPDQSQIIWDFLSIGDKVVVIS